MAFAEIALARGTTAYELSGPLDRMSGAPPVVLVPGMSSPSFVFDAIVPALAARHRVLRYDLYGRGVSAKPRVTYDLALYVEQLDELVGAVLGTHAVKVALVAYSWGAGLAAAWSAKNADRLARLVLIAPGGLEVSAAQRALALPGLGELAAYVFARRFLTRDLERGFVDPRGHDAYVARVLAQLDEPGFAHAFLSTLRHVPSDLGSYYAALGEHDVPTDVLWGTRDAKVPITLARRFAELVPRARVTPLEDAGHAAPVEHPAALAAAIVRVLDAS